MPVEHATVRALLHRWFPCGEKVALDFPVNFRTTSIVNERGTRVSVLHGSVTWMLALSRSRQLYGENGEKIARRYTEKVFLEFVKETQNPLFSPLL